MSQLARTRARTSSREAIKVVGVPLPLWPVHWPRSCQRAVVAKALGISEPEKKRCGRCGEIKTPDAFYAGRAECKGCTKSRHRRRRALGLAREADRRRYHTNPRYRAQVAANTARWKARNADKLRVHEAVAQAIQRGRLERQPCEVCGAAAHAHHRDYARPLEVQWLCPWHHARQHLAEGRLERRGVAS